MQRSRWLLLALSGARPEILASCPTERIKFESLGWSMLITGGLATVSMWFALTSAVGAKAIIAVAPAVAWGLVILGIDRWLVTSMPIDHGRRFAIAVPRLVLALLLGALISTPLVLRIFQSEINAEISVMKSERASTFLATEQNSSVGEQVAQYSDQVSNLEKVIDSAGAVALNPSADPVVQSLTIQLNDEIQLEQKYYRQWQCQLYGGTGCPAGNGPLAQASESNYQQARSQVTQLQSQIQQRETQLAATDKASEKLRYEQAMNALPGAQQQLKLAVARQNILETNFDTQNEATNGILIRLQALSQLSAGNFTVASARFLVFLLFLVIECLPVTVKLLQQPGSYEQILRVARESELSSARRLYRARPRTTPIPPAADAWGSDVDLRDIWKVFPGRPAEGEGMTEAPQPGQAPSVTATVPDGAPLDSGEIPPATDQALRSLEDERVSAGSDGQSGGIPLRWDDDDR